MTVNTASELEGIVVADANTATLVARYNEAKAAKDAADKRVESLKDALNRKFDDANAEKFSDELGDIIIARIECDNPERVDLPMLKRIAPAIYTQVLKPRGKHYRLTLPRISR